MRCRFPRVLSRARLDSAINSPPLAQDGVFVPKTSFGAPVVAALRKTVSEDVILDVKLSTTSPENRIKEFVAAGADIISVHPESTNHLPAVINNIVDSGCAAGVVLNPSTPVSVLEPVMSDISVVVVMLVNPGFGGKKYNALAVDKIKKIRSLYAAANITPPHISVDGGVSTKNAPALIEAGANVIVAGGGIFKAQDKAEAVKELLGRSAVLQ